MGTTAASLHLDGTEEFDLTGLDASVKPRQPVTFVVRRRNGARDSITLTLRVDTRAEIDYVQRGGILPYVLEGLMA